MRVLAVLTTATALLAPAPAPKGTCLAARSGLKTGTIMAEFEARQMAAMDRDEPPPFSSGDTVNVAFEITEGATKRIQNYAGVVIKRQGHGMTQTFTVRKMSSGIGVERTFPLYAPSVTKVEVVRRGSVRRSKLYYLRQLTGKSARIKEKVRGLSYVQKQEEAIKEAKAVKIQAAADAKATADAAEAAAAEAAAAPEAASDAATEAAAPTAAGRQERLTQAAPELEAKRKEKVAAAGDTGESRAETAIRFSLSNEDISCVVVGLAELEHLELAIKAAEAGPLPASKLSNLRDLWSRNFDL